MVLDKIGLFSMPYVANKHAQILLTLLIQTLYNLNRYSTGACRSAWGPLVPVDLSHDTSCNTINKNISLHMFTLSLSQAAKKFKHVYINFS